MCDNRACTPRQPPETKLEEDPPPDDLEKRIRIGCGAPFGIIPGLWFWLGVLQFFRRAA